jgi:surface carbohydrate biosynthesis protein
MNMLKPTVIFPIETKSRELASKVLLALECYRRGMRSYIGSKNAINYLVPKLRSGIFFAKSGMTAKAIEKLKKNCTHYVVLDEEIGLAMPHLSQRFAERIGPDICPIIDKIFVIGEEHKRIAHTVCQKSDQDICATGWPRIDLWRSQFVPYLQKEVTAIKVKYGNFILLSSNFGATSERMLNARLKDIKSSHVDEELKQFLQKRNYYFFQAFLNYIELIRQIVKHRPNLNIVIRPHPADDHQGWRDSLKGISNVHIVYQGELSPWLYGSQGLLHYGCTSGIQAALAGIPSLVYQRPTGSLGEPVSFAVSNQATTLEEVLTFIDQLPMVDASDVRAHGSAVIGNSIAAFQGELAVEKIADILASLCNPTILPITFSIRDHIIAEVRQIAYRFKVKLNRYLDAPRVRTIVSPQQKIPNGIRFDEIVGLINALAPLICLPTNKITCRHVSRDLVSIE